ncbi:hypothetical protein OSTOST_19066 [Ostertagia ostertagi]
MQLRLLVVLFAIILAFEVLAADTMVSSLKKIFYQMNKSFMKMATVGGGHGLGRGDGYGGRGGYAMAELIIMVEETLVIQDWEEDLVMVDIGVRAGDIMVASNG